MISLASLITMGLVVTGASSQDAAAPAFRIQLSGIGAVRCEAFTKVAVNQRPRIMCMPGRGSALIDMPLGESVSSSDERRGIEFQGRSFTRLREPMIIAVAASPHGSSTNW